MGHPPDHHRQPYIDAYRHLAETHERAAELFEHAATLAEKLGRVVDAERRRARAKVHWERAAEQHRRADAYGAAGE